MTPMDQFIARYPDCAGLRPAMEAAFNLLYACVRNDRIIWLCGNGGSAADCEHWAGELLKSFSMVRPLKEADRRRVRPPLDTMLQGGLRAVPLTGFPAFQSAFANDVAAPYGYAQLVWVLGRPGDVLVAISTSGDAENVVHAARVARARQMSVLGLTGRTGGRLKALADVSIAVPRDATYQVQELHLPVYHTLSLMLERTCFSEVQGDEPPAPDA